MGFGKFHFPQGCAGLFIFTLPLSFRSPSKHLLGYSKSRNPFFLISYNILREHKIFSYLGHQITCPTSNYEKVHSQTQLCPLLDFVLQIFNNIDIVFRVRNLEGAKQFVNKLLVIGSASPDKVDSLEWTQPFPDMGNYDALILDLASFPKDYPRTLFTNIGVLKRTARIFIRDNKEIFCILDKRFKVPFKKIPLNYAWIPYPEKFRINPMLLGKSKKLCDERFSEYMENVEKWYSELFWEDTANCSFDAIAVNKRQNAIAATLTINGRGKIHFLPKATRISSSEAITLLIGLAKEEAPTHIPWLTSVEIPHVLQAENQWNRSIAPEKYRNLFSLDRKKFVKAVQLMLEDLGIQTLPNAALDLVGLKSNIVVKTASMDGKVEAQNTQVSQVAKFVENPKRNEKVIFVANTYRNLPINERAGKEQVDFPMKLFFETHNVAFLTTLSLYNLWKKVITYQISPQEASFLLHNEKGEITV